MVRLQEDESDRLERILRELCEAHGFRLDVTGWTRKTFDVYYQQRRLDPRRLMVRVESLATSNGEVRFYADQAADFARALAERLEEEFNVPEAVLIHAADS